MNDEVKTAATTTKRYYVDRSGLCTYESNPWVRDLSLTIKTKNKITAIGRNMIVANSETGEIVDEHIALVNKKLVDREEFVKIFGGAISGMFDLTKTAQEMFKVVLEIYIAQDFMPDRIYLSENMLKQHGYAKTKTTRQNAINQLLEKRFLALMANEPNWYWVNPNMIFKGDRLTLVQEFAVKGTPSAAQLEKEVRKMEFESKQAKLEI